MAITLFIKYLRFKQRTTRMEILKFYKLMNYRYIRGI